MDPLAGGPRQREVRHGCCTDATLARVNAQHHFQGSGEPECPGRMRYAGGFSGTFLKSPRRVGVASRWLPPWDFRALARTGVEYREPPKRGTKVAKLEP